MELGILFDSWNSISLVCGQTIKYCFFTMKYLRFIARRRSTPWCIMDQECDVHNVCVYKSTDAQARLSKDRQWVKARLRRQYF